MKLILFDVDGTLMDSQAIIHETMRQTFVQHGYDEPQIEATRSVIGLTLDKAIAIILDRDIDDKILKITADYKENYLKLATSPDLQSLPFAGVTDLIGKLSEQDELLLGVVTGKSRRGVEKLFVMDGFKGTFITSRCADDCPSKPHPAMVLECCEEVGIEPDKTLVIGDTSFDMEMAISAGAKPMGVSWGYHPVENIRKAGALQIANTVSELDQFVGQWLGNEGADISSLTLETAQMVIDNA